MNINHKLGLVVVVVLAIAALVGASFLPQAPAMAAPALIPTPVSVSRPANAEAPGFITFNPFSAQVLTADTTSSCYDIGKYSVLDVLYSIDQTDGNTTTLTSKWSIDGTSKATGVNIVASNSSDATEITELQAFGRYLCVLADVTNTSPVTVTVQVLAK